MIRQKQKSPALSQGVCFALLRALAVKQDRKHLWPHLPAVKKPHQDPVRRLHHLFFPEAHEAPWLTLAITS